MVGTVTLVVVFTLTALAVVLYAAYCEAVKIYRARSQA